MTDAERLREIAEHILTTLNGSERVEDSRELRRIAVALDEREVIVEGVVDAEFCGVYQGEYDVDVKLSGKWSRLIGQHVSLVRRRT
jgi:hypothetical protein